MTGYSAEALALGIAGKLPRNLRWYAKHLVLGLCEVLGPAGRQLTLDTRLSEMVDWLEVPISPIQLERTLTESLPFEVDIGDPLEAGELTLRDLVQRAWWKAVSSYHELIGGGPRGPGGG